MCKLEKMKLITALLLCLGLTACGSGGGDNSTEEDNEQGSGVENTSYDHVRFFTHFIKAGQNSHTAAVGNISDKSINELPSMGDERVVRASKDGSKVITIGSQHEVYESHIAVKAVEGTSLNYVSTLDQIAGVPYHSVFTPDGELVVSQTFRRESDGSFTSFLLIHEAISGTLLLAAEGCNSFSVNYDSLMAACLTGGDRISFIDLYYDEATYPQIMETGGVLSRPAYSRSNNTLYFLKEVVAGDTVNCEIHSGDHSGASRKITEFDGECDYLEHIGNNRLLIAGFTLGLSILNLDDLSVSAIPFPGGHNNVTAPNGYLSIDPYPVSPNGRYLVVDFVQSPDADGGYIFDIQASEYVMQIHADEGDFMVDTDAHWVR